MMVAFWICGIFFAPHSVTEGLRVIAATFSFGGEAVQQIAPAISWENFVLLLVAVAFPEVGEQFRERTTVAPLPGSLPEFSRRLLTQARFTIETEETVPDRVSEAILDIQKVLREAGVQPVFYRLPFPDLTRKILTREAKSMGVDLYVGYSPGKFRSSLWRGSIFMIP